MPTLAGCSFKYIHILDRIFVVKVAVMPGPRRKLHTITALHRSTQSSDRCWPVNWLWHFRLS